MTRTRLCWFFLVLAIATVARSASAQRPALKVPVNSDSASLARTMGALAEEVLARYQSSDRDTYLNTTFRLQMVAGQYAKANTTLGLLRALRRSADTMYAPVEYTQYEIFATARQAQATDSQALGDAVRAAFAKLYQPLDNKRAYRVAGSFEFDLRSGREDLNSTIARLGAADSLTLADAIALVRKYHINEAYGGILPVLPALLRDDLARRYAIDDTVIIRTRDGAAISAVVVRPKAPAGRQPTVLSFTIYAGPGNLTTAMQHAANGYVGVVANTRGKRNGQSVVLPFERDGDDAYDVTDWISRQPWSNGKVGMYGGSYDGFTQWASMKRRVHPALKTITPSAAIVPGFDSPVENSIYQSFQYAWVPYVTNNGLLDDRAYGDQRRWNALDSTWFATGRAYRSLDSIDGTPNRIFRKWMDHPAYDAYWQAMTPQGKEFAHIGIPTLSITGYFDGAQGGALHYFREHAAQRPDAKDYLLIGPWDHFGSQARPSAVVAGYQTDPASRLDITGIIYEWMDHVMKGGARPAILEDRINYQVMGTNAWKHAPTLRAMSNDTLTLFLRTAMMQSRHQLGVTRGGDEEYVAQRVDLTDRTSVNDNSIHNPLEDSTADEGGGVVYESEPLHASLSMNGSLSGVLRATINKKDMDVGVQLYELTPEGRYFQLSFYVGRASYAKDKRRRGLLTPGTIEAVPFSNTRMISRRLAKGSRLVVVVNINKSSRAPINYGTGKNVADETIADGKVPLLIKWHASSYVKIPVWK
ncbi:MAG: CocE/NonD family hydrolase [bacterium]